MKTVVIVDDHDHVLILLNKYLQNEDYEVKTYNDSFEALSDLTEGRVQADLLISDISMPKLNGLQFVRELRKNRSTSLIKVIFLSALEDSFLTKKAHEIGIIDYILKPIDKEKLIEKIQTVLDIDA